MTQNKECMITRTDRSFFYQFPNKNEEEEEEIIFLYSLGGRGAKGGRRIEGGEGGYDDGWKTAYLTNGKEEVDGERREREIDIFPRVGACVRPCYFQYCLVCKEKEGKEKKESRASGLLMFLFGRKFEKKRKSTKKR